MTKNAFTQRAAPPAQTVQRALTVLDQFTVQQPTWRTIDLAKALGADASTISRLLSSLEHMGFVERDPQTARYRLGLALVTLGSVALATHELVQAATPGLVSLAEATGGSACIAVLREDAVFPLAFVDVATATQGTIRPGLSQPIHATALGVALIASVPRSEREQLLGRISYPRLTAATVSTPDQLRRKALLAAERGFATEDEEFEVGMAGRAAPVRGPDGRVIAACGVRVRVADLGAATETDQIASAVVEVARDVSRLMGYVAGAQPTPFESDVTASVRRRRPILVVP